MSTQRTTVYNIIASGVPEGLILRENIDLMEDFLDYLFSIDRAASTIKQYKNDLKIFWVWNLENNNNKPFVNITKREFAKFQSYCLHTWGWSPARIRRVKSVISSLGNFIENILDEEDEYMNYRSVVNKIESPSNEFVREKSVFTKDDILTLLNSLKDEEKYLQACVIALAAFSGRRKAELMRFKVSYFEPSNVIYGSLYKTPEKITSKGRGSKGKPLTMYVFKKDFDPWLNLWLEERERLGINESEWLFPHKTNRGGYNLDEHMKTHVLDTWCENFSNILGKPFYFHSLRHFFTSECFRNKLPSHVIQDILGWESADMCNLYNDISTEETLGDYFDSNGIKQHRPGFGFLGDHGNVSGGHGSIPGGHGNVSGGYGNSSGVHGNV